MRAVNIKGATIVRAIVRSPGCLFRPIRRRQFSRERGKSPLRPPFPSKPPLGRNSRAGSSTATYLNFVQKREKSCADDVGASRTCAVFGLGRVAVNRDRGQPLGTFF